MYIGQNRLWVIVLADLSGMWWNIVEDGKLP